MTSLYRFVNVMDGFPGAPGVNVMHFSAGTDILGDQHIVDSAYDGMVAMYTALNGYFSPEVTITVDPTAAVIDVASGELTGIISVSEPSDPIESISTANNSPRGTAALVQLKTDIFHGGRQLQGRVFFGPYSDDGLGTDGTIPTFNAGFIVDAFAAITSGTGPALAVYSRPKPIKVGGVITGYTEGYYGDVKLVNVPSRPSYLRGRMS
jgi:hypothetical protein